MVIDIVSVFCRRDYFMQLLQARSIAKYFNRKSLGQLIYIWHDTEEMPLEINQILESELYGISYKLLTASEFGIDRKNIGIDGWTTQQALKLLASKCVKTENYLVLDAKNHFVACCGAEDFIAKDGRGLFPFVDLKLNESYKYALEYFGLDLRSNNYCMRGVLNITPFLLRKEIVEKLIISFKEHDACSTVETFIRHQHKISEFLSYQAFVVSQGYRISDLYDEFVYTKISETIWGHIASQEREFINLMQNAYNEKIKVLGLHWIACSIMTNNQKTRLCIYWMNIGLCDTLLDGHEVIESVAKNLSHNDIRYLNNFLGF